MKKLLSFYDSITEQLRNGSNLLWPLLLRLIMFWEFWEAGREKLNGSNWFAGIQENFPIPFSWLSADVNWLAATWGELIFSVMLLLGLFTRFAAVSLIVITGVATAAVHWPEAFSLGGIWDGYAISNKGAGNFKLPLLFILLLIPLVYKGGGTFSLDNLLLKATGRSPENTTDINLTTYALPLAILGLALVWVMPKTGISLFIIAAGLAGYGLTKR